MRLQAAALLASLSCVLTVAAGADVPPPPKKIPVVKTWGDLFDAEPLDVGGRKVRLGIEAASFPAGGGVLMYCLADAPVIPQNGADVETVGPVSLHVMRGCPEMKQQFQRMGIHLWRMTGPQLYVGVVTAGSAGPLSVTIRRDGREDDRPDLARRDVTVTDEPFHGWTSLAPTDPPRIRQNGADPADRPRPMRATGLMGVPYRDGMHPFAAEGTNGDRPVRRERTEALPKLFPDESSPGLRLTFDGTTATVESDVPLPDRPEDGILVRWKVNGKPVIPSPLANRPMQMQMQQLRQMADGPKKVRLRLEWDPAEIGARSGDTVAAQLLLSPGGVLPVPHPAAARQDPIVAQGNADYVSRMTDAADFVVP